jgi:hypothetical protein
VSVRFAIVLALLAAGCGGAIERGEIEKPPGTARVSLTGAPAEVACIRIIVTGATREVERRLDSSSTTLDGLPTGPVLVSGDAFAVACDRIAGAAPSWVADAQSITLESDAVTEVMLVFRRAD